MRLGLRLWRGSGRWVWWCCAEPLDAVAGRRSPRLRFARSWSRLTGLLMMDAELRLRPLSPRDEAIGRAAHDALGRDGYAFFLDYDAAEPWLEFVGRVDRQRRGIDLPSERVPAAFLVAWVGNEIVGRTSIRFELNDYLASAGGHIGYAVLTAHRRRGYATEILRQSLVIARSHGVDDVLLTCAVHNVGSRAVIQLCGGELESAVFDPKEGVEKQRFWIR